MAYRASTGDFYTDTYSSEDTKEMTVVAWIVFIVAVFILNIVLMNFIIAVIS